MNREYTNKLDHLVYATPDLASTVEMMTSLLGVTPTPGGKHAQFATENYLVGLGPGRYLEIIGPDPALPRPSMPRPFGIDTLVRPRLVTWAIFEDDLEVSMGKAREQGYDPGVIVPLSRELPEGPTLEWRLVVPPPTAQGFVLPGDGLVPFIIDWGATPHPSNELGQECQLLELRGAHPAPEKVTAMLSALDIVLSVDTEATPCLTAIISTPTGKVALR